MRLLYTLMILAIAMCTVSTNARADAFQRGDGLTLIWVTIDAKPNEGLWQTCRRVYQRDVYQVRRGRGFTVQCNIDHSRIYDFGERLQNFNRLDR